MYDYTSDGYYFVTIVSRLRQPLFVDFEELIEQVFHEVAESFVGVKIDTITVMSNHVHCIIHFEKSNTFLGEVARRAKAKISYLLKQQCWQANYYEHIIRNEESLGRIREYILHNPEIEQMRLEYTNRPIFKAKK